jgi:hypothetical protein
MTEHIRKLPAQEPRVETGPVQFGDDWPGLFIRGDNASHYYVTLRRIIGDDWDQLDIEVIKGLMDDLKSSQL